MDRVNIDLDIASVGRRVVRLTASPHISKGVHQKS